MVSSHYVAEDAAANFQHNGDGNERDDEGAAFFQGRMSEFLLCSLHVSGHGVDQLPKLLGATLATISVTNGLISEFGRRNRGLKETFIVATPSAPRPVL